MKSSNKQYGKRLLILAFPIIMNNIIAQLQMIIDRIFLGHANDLYMSALGNVSSPVWTTMSFCNSLVMGASILISQSVGAKKREDIGEYAGAMLKYNNIIPIFLCFFWMIFPKPVFMILGVSDNVMPLCLGYVRWYAPLFLLTGLGGSLGVILQTSNYTKPLVVYGCVRSGFNIFLDWMLIFGNLGMPALGIEGAAIATVIAEYVGAIYISVIFFTSKRLPTRPSWNDVKKGHFQSYLNAAKLGINIALEDFAWNIGNLILIRILNSINEYAAGIYTIIFGVEVLAVVIIGAIGSGTMTLTSEATGRKDLAQYKGITLCAYAVCTIVTVVMIVGAVLFPEQILSLFTSDKTVIASCGGYLLLIGINLFSKSGNIIIGNAIRGSGNTKWMLFTQIFGTIWIVSVASVLVFICKLGIFGVVLAVILDEGVRALINLGKYLRIVKKWENGMVNLKVINEDNCCNISLSCHL